MKIRGSKFIALAMLVTAGGCYTLPPPPAPATLTVDEVESKLAALEKAIPTKPTNLVFTAEWASFHVYLKKAQFLRNFYRPSDSMLTMISRDIAHAEESISAIQSNRPLPLIIGEREEGYYSENDASFQPFLRYLPPTAKKGKKMPLIVYLHGYSPSLNIANWAEIPTNLVEFARTEGFCIVAPFGRSNTDFQGIGEQDVLRAMAEMMKRYSIDEDRVILAGISMGGMGVWTIGAHYPDLFAGLLVLAGRGDYYFWQNISRNEVPPYKQRLIDTEFAISLLPNLKNIPIFCAHGGKDSLVPVEEARHIVEAAQKVNPHVTYVELENEDHWIFEEMFGRSDTRQWMKTCRRKTPLEFSYRSFHPKYDQCYWVSGMDFVRDSMPAETTVRQIGGKLSIAATGVSAIEIRREKMPRELRNLPIVKEGNFGILYRNSTDPSRTAAVCGPVKEAFLSPFVFVFAGDLNNSNRVEQFRQRVVEWYRYTKAFPRVTHEKYQTEKELAAYNTFLFGEPERSALIKKVLEGSPIRITADAYEVGSRKFPREGNGICFAYKSPWNPGRLVVVQCGIPWGEGLGENHRYDFLPDYIVYSSEKDKDGSNHALCAGFFDSEWSIPSNTPPSKPTVGTP